MEELGTDYEIVFLPSYLDDQINECNIFSARGIYINYFRFEDHIIFPSFENSKGYESEIVRMFNKRDFYIHFSPLDKTALEGGCFNCISSVKFK